MTAKQSQSLRHTHPNLFKSLALKGGFLILLGTFFITGLGHYILETDLPKTSQIIPLPFWGIVFLINGALLIYGISDGTKRYKWGKVALILGASLTGLWAVGYAFAFFQGYTHRILAPLFWAYVSGTLAIWAGEPTFNPVAAMLNSKGSSDDYH